MKTVKIVSFEIASTEFDSGTYYKEPEKELALLLADGWEIASSGGGGGGGKFGGSYGFVIMVKDE